MSVPDQVPKTELIASGASITQFDYTFYAPVTSNIHVLVNGSAVSSGWSVSSNEGGSGFVKFDSPVVTGATVTIYRSTPMRQTVSLGQAETFYPQVITDCMDNVVMGMQEMRGGMVNIPGQDGGTADYASSAGSASSAGYATTAGALVGGGTVSYASTAKFASSAGYLVASAKNQILSSAASQTVISATNAGTAGALTGAAKTAIISSAVSSAAYNGPFAVYFSGGRTAVNSGYVFSGGTGYPVSSGDDLGFSAGDTMYLVMSNSSGSMYGSYTTSAHASTSDTLVTRLAQNAGGTIQQIQYGDITWQTRNAAVVSGMLAVDYEDGSIVCMESKYTTGDATEEHPYQLGTGLGGIVLGTIRAPANPGVNFDVSLVVNQGGAGTAFEVIHSGTSEVFVSVPFGPETKFHFGAFNGTPSADLHFYPYYLVNNNN